MYKLEPECPMVCNPEEPTWQSWMQLHGDRVNGGGLGPSKEILQLGLGGEGGCPARLYIRHMSMQVDQVFTFVLNNTRDSLSLVI